MKTSSTDLLKPKLRIGIYQFDIQWEQPKANVSLIADCLSRITPPDIFVLPEMCTTGFSMNAQKIAEPMTGPSISEIQRLANMYKCAICGSIAIEDGNHYFNRFLFWQPNQEIIQYDKTHLFGYGGEAKVYSSGNKKCYIHYKDWTILPFICYDLRFPVWLRNTGQIDLYLGVANWPQVRVRAWTSLLTARAIENQAYVVGVNRVGSEPSGLRYNGQSQIIQYDGQTVIDAKDQSGYFECKIDQNDLLSFREKYPFLSDRDEFILK